jgi:uncharacterized repeat protein (TIGR01451 family)
MQRKKQVVYWFTIFALMLATVGVLPAGAAKIADSSASQPAPKQTSSIKSVNSPTAFDDQWPAPPAPRKDTGDDGEDADLPLERADAFYSKRLTHDPAVPFTMYDATQLRDQAANEFATMLKSQPATPSAFGGAWANVGPDPMVQVVRGDNTFDAMTGRIGALAIRSSAPYTMYLGGAQGGVWTLASPYTGTWTAKTDQLSSLAIGAIALAPSNEDIVYVGTGEGALSGDSYFGNGVLKSLDGGGTFFKVSAAGYFTSVSISKIVVDAADPNTLYVGTLRGRGGARRTSPPDASPFGVWKSTDGGVNYTLVLTASLDPLEFAGVTDLAMDPQDSQVIFASMLGRGISKTVDGGANWTTAMTGLPAGDYTYLPTRVALGIGHLVTQTESTVYAGFELQGTSGYITSKVYKSTDSGANWAVTTDTGNVVRGYCGTQCTYDNVLGVDPSNPNIVYALGLYNYGTGSGGIFRSVDGGDHWVDLGFNLHPDYHAFAVRKDDPSIVVMGNDGGVWWSPTRGGRLSAGDPITATTWHNLNGLVNPATAAVQFSSHLVLGQFTSVATNPTVANRFYGGTQDNGTFRKATGTNTWFDLASGDGGQVLVDPTDANFVFGTYYGISPYRFTDGMANFFTNASIKNNIPNDRSEFYIPWILDPANSNRLYLGTYRVFRADNAKTPNAGDVYWNTISADLTSGCTGPAANGARGCVITAFGKSAGSPALFVGTAEGWVWLTTDSTVASPVWNRVDISGTTPLRPVSAFAVDRSNYRLAYAAFNGFSAATPSTPGHVFKTTDGGQTWTNISSNLPDIPVNSIIQDASDPNTLYAGTDVGPYVSTDDGASWAPLGTGFPIVTIWQLALNTFTRQMIAGTHGRGIWRVTDSATALPALQISKSIPDVPVGPGGLMQYNVTVSNYGNITATNVVITDPIPANTTFVAAGPGGSFDGTQVVWTVPQVAKPVQVATGGSLGVGLQPGETTVTFTVQITTTGVTAGSVITNDGFMAMSAEGPGAVGSPFEVTLSPGYAVSAAPASQSDGTRAGQSLAYRATIYNDGFNTDSYDLAVSGNAWPTTIWDASMTNQITQTGSIPGGGSVEVVLKVSIPLVATNGQQDAATLTATSMGDPLVSAAVAVQSTAVTYDVLVVDNDDNNPNVSGYYTAALNTLGVPYDYWDLSAAPLNALPLNFLKAHKTVVWFTGMSYPGPILPYEGELAAFLDGGGKLFMSGQDILDQAAGTTPFVHDYLHINWDGTDVQNDTGALTVTAVITSPFASGLGATSMSYPSGFVDYADQITPIYPAEPAFVDNTGQPDALQVDAGAYKVIFLAFPFEAMSGASQRAATLDQALNYLAANNAVTGANLTGPTLGRPGVSYDFMTSIAPITTTRPVRYYWEASDQSPLSQENLSTDMASFTWSTPGTKLITVTASNEEAAVQLSGTEEVPPVNTTGAGLVYFTYNRATRELAYTLSVSGMSPTMAHIHRGAVGVSGPIAYVFSATPFTTTLTGVFTLSASDEALLFSDGLYVNAHSTAYPSGEIRGQIHMTGGYATASAAIDLPAYQLTVNTVGNGTVTQEPQPPYYLGDMVTLTATAGTGSSFAGWSGDLSGMANPITITMDADKVVTATFTTNLVNLTVNTVGDGTVAQEPTGPYSYGDVVTLTATANTGSSFAGWSGDLSGMTSLITITLDADKVVTATFTANPVNLTVNTVGNGTVAQEPAGPYSYGDVVTLTATAGTGSSFAGWSGDLSGMANPITITLDADKGVTATFTLLSPDLWVQTTGPATAKVGDIVTYTITYGNDGSGPAANAWITDTVLASTTPITQFVIPLGMVPAAPFSMTLAYTLPVLPVYAGITFTNQVQINTTDVDLNPANDAAQAQTFVGAPPVAAFTGLTAAKVNTSVSFTNASVGTPPLTYLWNFGDGSATTTTVNTTHVYTRSGVFTVTLMASSSWGPDNTYSVPITIEPYGNYLPIIRN